MDIKLLHGDCLELMKDIPDKSVEMILADLPYGTTACKWDTVIPFVPLWEQYERIIKDNGVIVLFGSEPFSSALRMSNKKIYKYDWVWEKNQPTGFLNAKKQPLRIYEMIHIFYKKQSTYNPQFTDGVPYTLTPRSSPSAYGAHSLTTTSNSGYRYPRNLIKFSVDNNKQKKERYHPTQKPVSLLEYLIRTYTNEGELVLDNTMGSGSTGVACVNTNRKFIGIELDDKYFEIAKRRIIEAQKFWGDLR